MDASPSRTRHTTVIACFPDGRTRAEDRVLPAPGPGELILRTSACGLCGTDLFKLAVGGIADGTVLGHELVGVVEETGPDPARFAVGDRIVVPHHVACGECAFCRRGSDTQCSVFRENLMLPGGFASRVLIGERAVRLAARPVPDTLDDRAAIFMEPAACVLRGIERAQLAAEDGSVAVIGSGSMGLLHVLVLRAFHPRLRILACDPVHARQELARTLGADAACSPNDLAEAASTLSAGLGADAVFDTVGGASVLSQSVALTRPGGSVVLFAHAGPGEPAGFEINSLFKLERRVLGTYSGGLAEQRAVFDALCDGRLDPVPLVTHTLPLAQFDEAVRLAVAREALKVLLVSRESA